MFEKRLEENLLSQNTERTSIDKILARNEVERVKELVKKDKLTRSELLELLYMCLSTETKLLNIGSWDRYVILKFFVWIREFIKIAELMYDHKEFLEKKHKNGEYQLRERTKQILENNERLIEHNAKFLIDLYFNILRTTLSLGATGFLEILNNKYEINYPNQGVITPINEKKDLLQRVGLKGSVQNA